MEMREILQMPDDPITIEVEGQTVGLPTVTSPRIVTLVRANERWGWYRERVPKTGEMERFLSEREEESSRRSL